MMRVAILNPQANFSKVEKGWPQKPDFGGQLIYVRELANALSKLNVRVDIITRKFRLEGWSDYNESASFINENLRILRLPCGPSGFVPKESLWPYLEEWKQQIVDHYYREEEFPHVCSAHYADGGYVGYLIKEELSIPFTFTSHSLGGPKIDKLLESGELPHEFLKKYRFDKRILAESISIQTATKIVASTDLEIENQYGHPLYEPEHLSNKEKFSKVSPGINHNFFSQNELLNEK
ncbi:MAG: glycosyltransferase, partial [Bacteroidota bacterium]